MARSVAAIDNEKAMRAGVLPFAIKDRSRVHATVRRLLLSDTVGRVLLLGPACGTDDAAQPIGDLAHADCSTAPVLASIKSRMRSATVLAIGPVLPIGPTHVGHPFWHSHPAMRSRVRRRSSSSIAYRGSLKPMPPG